METPPWIPGYGARRTEGVPPSQMRISDAERQEVADELSRHFADGRLDREEFDDRMHKAMGAKTRGDLSGLLEDLPRAVRLPEPATPRRRRSRSMLVLIAAALFVLWSTSWAWYGFGWHMGFWHPHPGPFLVLFVLAMVFARRRRWRGSRWNAPL